eukprot:gnl/TRDRNA2_/TRDRNA2_191047_c0_seq1.p1 gnl/TRDRNA2_/TRDRNA2_191047_c0~~gnl/TRDRNA2_/TRDRNA2_191047_c0_seq1.p1  ORF type:complete len:513 (+),score=93.24 gnl/TRDRNA2_/TRDRNA2_191047_c0_seq1:63-1601(+)
MASRPPQRSSSTGALMSSSAPTRLVAGRVSPVGFPTPATSSGVRARSASSRVSFVQAPQETASPVATIPPQFPSEASEPLATIAATSALGSAVSNIGVSAAYLVSYLAEHSPGDDAPPEKTSTRAFACSLKRRMAEGDFSEEGAFADHLAQSGETHFVTGSAVAGPTAVHVAHAWDANFRRLVDTIARDAAERGADGLDQCYWLDVFGMDLRATPSTEPAENVRRRIAAADEVLLVLDADGHAFKRLFVLLEAMLASAAGKLKVRCSSKDSFGCSLESLRRWEDLIDTCDWGLAQTARNADDKRLRRFAQSEWEVKGKGIENAQARFKMDLRREVYGQILIAAVKAGDRATVEAALDLGADPARMDELGNTAEELASFEGDHELEELLFVKRVGRLPHLPLSAFVGREAFTPAAALHMSDTLASFLTEPGGRVAADDEDDDVHGAGAGDWGMEGDEEDDYDEPRTASTRTPPERSISEEAMSGASSPGLSQRGSTSVMSGRGSEVSCRGYAR